MQWALYLMVTFFGAATLGSYVVVLGNVNNAFPIDNVDSFHYLRSPYWLDTPRDTVLVLVAFQGLAAVGFLMWFAWIAHADITASALRLPWVRVLLLMSFLMASLMWPFAAYAQLIRPASTTRALISSSCLWVAAVSVIAMIGLTFEARAPPLPTAGVLLLGNAVVLMDGVGWSAMAIYRSLYGPHLDVHADTARVA